MPKIQLDNTLRTEENIFDPNEKVTKLRAKQLEEDFNYRPPTQESSPSNQGDVNDTPDIPVGDIYKGLIPSNDQALDDAYSQYGDTLKRDLEPIDEAAIRRRTLEQFQAEVDALNKVYANKIAEERVCGEGRLGSNRVI